MNVARAYDRIAPTYDEQLLANLWVRHVLWEHYARTFDAGAHVLDVGCGTGIDTLFLAQRGLRVTGIDVSAAMIDRLRAKAERQGLSARVATHVADAAALGPWAASRAASFDGIISGFGGLNTVADLAGFASNAATLLRPEGRMIVHMINPASLWERLNLFRRGRWRAAVRLRRQTTRTFQIGGLGVVHHLAPAQVVYDHSFAPHFTLRHRYGLAILRPPPNKDWLPPALIDTLTRLERRLNARAPFRDWGRFFVLELERRPS